MIAQIKAFKKRLEAARALLKRIGRAAINRYREIALVSGFIFMFSAWSLNLMLAIVGLAGVVFGLVVSFVLFGGE